MQVEARLSPDDLIRALSEYAESRGLRGRVASVHFEVPGGAVGPESVGVVLRLDPARPPEKPIVRRGDNPDLGMYRG